MSGAKHTPGPWFVVDHSKDEQCMYIESAKDGVASVFTDTPTRPEEIAANARLVAAAPELLEALKHTLRAFQTLYAEAFAVKRDVIRIVDIANTVISSQAEINPEKIIAKAEGREC